MIDLLKSIIDLPISMKGDSKRTSGNSLNLWRAQPGGGGGGVVGLFFGGYVPRATRAPAPL